MSVRGTHNRDDVRGSDEARSISRGMKQKELDDSLLSGGLALAAFFAFMAGMATSSWIVAGIVFFVFFAGLGYWYYKE
jgi:hypothetical protein